MGVSASLECSCLTLEDPNGTNSAIVAPVRAGEEDGCSGWCGEAPSQADDNIEVRAEGKSKQDKPGDSNASTRSGSRATSKAASKANSRNSSPGNKPGITKGSAEKPTNPVLEQMLKNKAANSPSGPSSDGGGKKDKVSKTKDKAGGNEDGSETDSSCSIKSGEDEKMDIEELCKVELKHKDWDALLLLASAAGHSDMVIQCLQNDSIATVADNHEFWCGYHAATSGDLETLKQILEHDVHGAYKLYFQDKVTSDHMTPLMVLFRLGLSEIYEYLMDKLGCCLHLRGERYGSQEKHDPNGYDMQLHSWLEFVPEINTICQVTKRRPLELAHRRLDLNKPITDEVYHVARQARLVARNRVREILQNVQKANAAKAGVAPVEKRGAKRGALQFMTMPVLEEGAEAAPQPNNTDYDFQATVEPNEEDPDSIIWSCGGCKQKKERSMMGLLDGKVMICDGCQKRNFVLFREDDSDDGEGEEWGNEGSEFNNENTVRKYLAMFKKSVMMALGNQRLRQLLRIAKFEKYDNGKELFKKDDDMDGIYVLACGIVVMRSRMKGTPDEEIEVEAASPDQPQPRMLVLDMRACMVTDPKQAGKHQSTCFIKSKGCRIFKFKKTDIVEYCACGSMEDIIRQSLAIQAVQSIPLFKIAFTTEEAERVSEVLKYYEYYDSHQLISEGQRLGKIVIVQRGSIKVTEGKKSKTLHIGENTGDVPAGHFKQAIFIIGVRLLLYDMASTTDVKVEGLGSICECWVMEIPLCEPCMRETSVLHHLQIGTYIMFFQKVVLFKRIKFSDPRLKKLIMDCSTEERWNEDDIMVQSSIGESLYIVMEGTVEVFVSGESKGKQSADLDHDKVLIFGELCLIDRGYYPSTVKVRSASATLLIVEQRWVNESFGSIEKLCQEQGFDSGTAIEILKDKNAGKKPAKGQKFDSLLDQAKTSKNKKEEKFVDPKLARMMKLEAEAKEKKKKGK